MKYIAFFGCARFVASMLALLCVGSIGVDTTRTHANQNDRYAQSKENFKAAVRDGIGTEVQFAAPGDDNKNVRASIESAAQFMRKRSGVDLRGQTKTRLAEMEASTLAGTTRRITPDELSEIIASTAIERISAASDEEIDRAAETLRGFDAPDLPDSFRRGRARVRLRSSMEGTLTPDQFASQVKAIRDADPILKYAVLKPMAIRAASSEIKSCTRNLSEAVPEQFGSAATDLTPLQAVLTAYSIVSEDRLAYSSTNLQKRMEGLQDLITKTTGKRYPSPNGYLAYGPNGYLVSTPLDMVFDERTVNLLLDHIAERSVSQ